MAWILFVSNSPMAFPNFNKVLSSKWQFSARCNSKPENFFYWRKQKETSHPDRKSTSLWTDGSREVHMYRSFNFSFWHCTSLIFQHITIQIVIISVLDYLLNLNPENWNNNHHFCRSQHNWWPSTSINGRFISAHLCLMLLGWPKQTDAGWTTPIDAHRLDGHVRQTDSAQPQVGQAAVAWLKEQWMCCKVIQLVPWISEIVSEETLGQCERWKHKVVDIGWLDNCLCGSQAELTANNVIQCGVKLCG